jgi:WD40 repeat protein
MGGEAVEFMRQILTTLSILPVILVACTTQQKPSLSPTNLKYTHTPISALNAPLSPPPTYQQLHPTSGDVLTTATLIQPTPITQSTPQVINITNAHSITETTKIQLSPWELVHALDWSPDGSILGVAAGGTISLFADGDYNKMLTLNPGVWSPSIVFSPESRLIAAGGRDGFLRIWDTQSGNLISEFEAHKKGVNSVAFSPDGQLLASGGNDAMARLWATSTGDKLSQMIGGTFAIPAIAFTVDGESLAIANGDIIRVRDVTDQRFVSTLRGENSFYSLSSSADGRFVAAGDTAGAVFIWELSSERVSYKLTTREVEEESISTLVWNVAFSPDGRLIACADGYGLIYIWDVTTGELLATLHGHSKAVSTISFSPDGRVLASGGLDGVIIIWQSSR